MAAQQSAVRWIGLYAVITAPAGVDVTNTGQTRDAFLTATGLGALVLIIDMSATTFCDSAGIQAVLLAHRRTAASRTQLRLAATTTVRRILTMVGVDQLIPIHPTLQAALAEP